MSRIVFVLSFLIVPYLMASEKFKINKKNCNLPMNEIRKILPDPEDQKNALKKCMEKARKEKWSKKSLSS